MIIKIILRSYFLLNILFLGGFDILVLTAGAWPLNQKDDQKSPQAQNIQIPAEVIIFYRKIKFLYRNWII